MPYFENNGAKLYYEETGKGEPLVFLHGATWDLHEWDRQVAHYSPNYRVITMDARGHGQSTLPPGKVSPDIFWQDARALLDHLGIESAIFCGLSMGGHTSLQLAFLAPERVKKLILIGSPCSNSFNLFEKICVPINRFCMRIMPMSLIAWSIAVVLGKHPESKTYIRRVVSNMKHRDFVRLWYACTSMESRDGITQIKCPTLIMVGAHDFMTLRQQNFIHESIAGSKLVFIEDASHGTNLDNPDQIEAEIDAFLG